MADNFDFSVGKPEELLVTGPALDKLKEEAKDLPTITLTPRQLCDVEMLLNGGFSPLEGFLNEDDYKSVVENTRLTNGKVWPMPITLDVSEETSKQHKVGDRISLRDEYGNALAILTVGSIYTPDKARESEMVFGSPDDQCHPSIEYIYNQAGAVYMGGKLEGISLPNHYDFTDLRMTPAETRAAFRKAGYVRVVAFQTRNPMHRSHRELTLRAARDAKANVFIHPVVGMTKPGDVDYFTRVRVYLELLKTYPPGMTALGLLPLAMRMAGPREALWHALIRQNYGATHFVIGRDHAGPGKNKNGDNFYGDYDAQNLVRSFESELRIKILTYNHMVYVEERGEYFEIDKVPEGCSIKSISGTELRRRLQKGIDIPPWFSFPNVVKVLRASYPPRHKQGFTVFFTGFSGSGKSTIASALSVAFLEDGRRPVTTLDGDEFRRHLSSNLGYSQEDRNTSIKRVSYVASHITKSRAIAIVCAISPYEESRAYAKRTIEASGGGFVLVHISTPIEVCEARDSKGLYKKARSGELKGLTGIDDPYEVPANADIVIDASKVSVRQSVHEIILHLEQAGYLSSNAESAI
uniref:Sulfate adenylyltransferase n=1 Tax=Paramoeba aestuarina TaxID=180227 RepID=A0A7S4NQB7_9EUKA|mmetsp:Transcript_23936/g.37279  ORF Transcript_23936/g.37279 Transcript_23936/m.37279 type:complete len:580 (+) Transcript_23936:80-1819(+)|eukprot:CAMPEP_0201515510 /NCGR_PEP_ID=MMETSP0161_2-20130828/7052_1 /ASSEMBLY_ACC=CAM_ASM_000251 /TAXON_ID=180227 /ORGANISM="Neoparamoeba aestuarina, Strain SoJaBio B1-5/56/2" /LENGTH=579 /DNA_ID=CAMNT_0047912351 /DNA_START=59 /DNA_END=1798 /DNA_ORIENTATION=-